ncbi:GNAT family N-acetyltransferase [Acuticoccus sediminis]|uniref:GNAT family N-acetyltransferase n=1 Tax=Acuticoccus sediminis TaxID=2184697 RepID=A0A8B2NZ51_9HYPH|nr:GNAT family N-acetyltransferase [Acuticoccus sediminis]RAI03156.1 GNAT family N-acetyltransferase [Acuticoccus sediminis]
MTLTVTRADLAAPEVLTLLAAHAAHCSSLSPPESCHFLTADGLDVPEVTVWAAWDGTELAGVGALKALPDEAGEIKSMHTAAAQRGKGVGKVILETILAEAERRGYHSLWLETGTIEAFGAARRLYERYGFAVCEPFGDYRLDPHSIFYTKTLETPEAVR